MMRLEDVWSWQEEWSALAVHTRRWLDRWRAVNLWLIVVGAAFGVAATQTMDSSGGLSVGLGVVAAVALTVAGGVRAWLVTPDQLRMWTTARSTAESLKALVFQYRVGVAPYADDDRVERLAGRVREVLAKATDFDGQQAAFEGTGAPFPLSAELSIADYVAYRARDQRDWHRKRGRDHQRLANRFRAAEISATILAATLSAVGAIGHGELGWLLPWESVATTVGAAFAASAAASAYQRIANSYAGTVTELNLLLASFDPDTATPEQQTAFVTGVEAALAAQNDGWASIIARP